MTKRQRDTKPRLTASPRAAKKLAQPPGASGILSLDEAVASYITAALRKARGRIEGGRGAAAMLKINPHTLRAKMRKLGIDWTKYREE